MLTIFTAPKPFVGHIGVIQRNALESWACLRPEVEIILCGDEDGVEAAAADVGALHARTVMRNAYGTPLVSSVFREARETASRPVLAYANADLIFLPDLLEAIASVRLPRYLIAGRRRNVRVHERLDFDRPDWRARLRERSSGSGRLERPWGSDYFVFPADAALGELPPFAIGRPLWDNWLFYRARSLGVPVVDATKAITAIHQVHGYDHIASGSGAPWDGPEADANRALSRSLTGGRDRTFHLWDATHVLTASGTRRALGPEHLWRRLKMRVR